MTFRDLYLWKLTNSKKSSTFQLKTPLGMILAKANISISK